MDQLIEEGEVRCRFIGAGLQAMTEGLAQALGDDDVRGVLVSEVTPDGPVDDAGLRMGDIILQLDGQEIEFPPRCPGICETRRLTKAAGV